MPLTPTQGTILAAIHALTTEHKYAPTLREIADRAGMASASAVSRQTNRLDELGYVERQPGTPRSIRLAQSITHAAAPPSPEEHPRALLEAHAADRECIECGRNVDLDTNRHHWDLTRARGGAPPAAPAHRWCVAIVAASCSSVFVACARALSRPSTSWSVAVS